MVLPIEKFEKIPTPFYYYDIALFERTAKTVLNEANKYGYRVHYALKANANTPLLKILSGMGFGADCVSGGEVQRAVDCGFEPSHIAFAGVGKRDDEILLGLKHGIFTFNCESEQEIEVINQLAESQGIVATIALRINPNVDAHTHKHITTGLDENKFGINLWQLTNILGKLEGMRHVKLTSIHFHIGSQITSLAPFKELCLRVNEIQDLMDKVGVQVQHVNLGGGLGVDYYNPSENPIADFEGYFRTIHENLNVRQGQQVHVELGRSLVAQCGALITKCLYVKELQKKNFIVLDAGMTDLIRPALYNAYHRIENLSNQNTTACKVYDVVGPICESTDTFAQDTELPISKRGDYLALLSAGAYGEVMASNYNLRKVPEAIYSK